MTEKEKQNLRKKWKVWLKTIGHNLGNLLISKDIHDEIRCLAAFNKNIRSPLLFHNWLVNNYVDSISIRVRQIGDPDKRSISLYRLIRDILNNKKAITRQYYVSCYPKDMQNDGCADHDFDDFANKKDELVSTYKLERDLKRLKKDTARIRIFVDKWVAHCDLRRNMFKVPTHKQLNNTLQDIDELYCKYLMLITGQGMTTCKLILPYDWKEPLRHAWLTRDYKKKIEHRVQKAFEGMSGSNKQTKSVKKKTR